MRNMDHHHSLTTLEAELESSFLIQVVVGGEEVEVEASSRTTPSILQLWLQVGSAECRIE